jgi:hypothetical protein
MKLGLKGARSKARKAVAASLVKALRRFFPGK